MIPSLFAAIILHHIVNSRWQYIYRVCFIIPMIIPAMVGILMWKSFYEPNLGIINQILRYVGILGKWDSIRWLSDPSLVLISLIFVGFPWVGAFGVLVYLAGLQNISKDIYEAAELDGAGPLRVFWNVELPLIMTQIRINLVLTIVATIQGWEFIYVFLGENGGPGGKATVPGLLLFRESFSYGHFGYGCAIGFFLFLLTLVLTCINNKYIRIDK
jgi:raffinose/stachyose/melibiose transport system permease protein